MSTTASGAAAAIASSIRRIVKSLIGRGSSSAEKKPQSETSGERHRRGGVYGPAAEYKLVTVVRAFVIQPGQTLDGRENACLLTELAKRGLFEALAGSLTPPGSSQFRRPYV
jgi:hypothetical protein